jgi:hypothetical protein
MNTQHVNQVAETIWEQIPKITKMQIGACRPQALTMQVGEREMPGIGLHINPAVGSFIPLDVDVENNPRFKMVILLDEDADTYIVHRYRVRDDQDSRLPEPVLDWSLDDVYFDQFEELLYDMTTYDPPSASATTVA